MLSRSLPQKKFFFFFGEGGVAKKLVEVNGVASLCRAFICGRGGLAAFPITGLHNLMDSHFYGQTESRT